MGPIVRLPLRLLRWLVQHPDLDPSARNDRLASQLDALQQSFDQLSHAHERLHRDQERTSLILFMLCAKLDQAGEAGVEPRLDGRRLQRYAAE